MHLVDIRKYHVMVVRLENGIDFKPSDCVRFPSDSKAYGCVHYFEISESKLQQLAKSIGFDECSHCGKLSSINQLFVQAEFIRKQVRR